MIFVLDIKEDFLSFGEIIKIFIKDHNLYLLMKELENEYFNEHIFAYKIKTIKIVKYIQKNVSDLLDIFPCL